MNTAGNFQLDAKDPTFIPKYMVLQGVNQVSDWNRQNRSDRDNMIIFVFSILIGIISAVLIEYHLWAWSIFLADILILIAIWKTLRYMKERIQLRKTARELILGGKNLGMTIPGTEELI